MTNTEKPFLGPKPEVAEPVWVTPFRAVDGLIRDANDNHVGGISGDTSRDEDDYRLVELIVTLVNQHVEADPVVGPIDPKVPFVGRTIFHANETIDAAAVKGGWAFAYEVAPGRFWFTTSRAAALEETAADPEPGWSIDEYGAGQYLDIETGEFVPVS